MIDDTYNDNDNVNRKPINNMIDHGEQRLTLYIINYGVSDSSTGIGCSDDYDDGYVDITSANKVECFEWYMQKDQVDNKTRLDWILKWYRVDNDDETAIDEQSEGTMKRKDGECHMKAKFHTPDLLDYLDGICSNSHTLKLAHSLQVMLSYPNPDPLKRTHLPQGMLSLIDPTGCYVMKRKDEEWY